MTRLLHRPVSITVEGSDFDCPHSFFWDGMVHPIEDCNNSWRVDVEWWRLRVCRDYYMVHTTTGLLVVIYRDMSTNLWYLQRLYG